MQVLSPLDTYQPPVGLSRDRARQLLDYADPADYDEWLRGGMALHHEYGGDPAGLAIWNAWSSTASNYEGVEDLEKRWEGFGDDRGHRPVTMRWLLKRESDLRRASASDESATYTDIGNARRLATRHGERLRYAAGGFLVHEGARWVRDENNVCTQGLAKEAAFAMLDDVKTARDQTAAFNHARRSQSKSAVDNMIALVRSEPGIRASLDDFDADPMLLNVRNGTIDLRTGELRAHGREDLITKMAPVDFVETATCPLWLAFLNRIMGENDEVIAYLKRFVGYLLTGLTVEQCLVFLYGLGANGKSVFVETLLAMLGDYAVVAQAEMLMARKYAGIPNDIARLKGARLVCMNETSQGAHFDEAKLKELTGGDRLTARFLNQEFFDFAPTFKLAIRGNHRPRIAGTDDGIWRRLHIVPFAVQIPAGERDGNLPAKLRNELPGVLQWAVEGCIEWQASGLKPPAIVTKAVEDYRESSDTLGRFLAECCELDALGEVQSKPLYIAYRDFCIGNSEQWIAQREFPEEMQRRGLTHKKTKAAQVFRGVRLRPRGGLSEESA
jgi:putative DNA primase/helicase